MTLDELNAKAQDNLLDVMQTIKVFKAEILALNETISSLNAEIEMLKVSPDND